MNPINWNDPDWDWLKQWYERTRYHRELQAFFSRQFLKPAPIPAFYSTRGISQWIVIPHEPNA